MTWIATLFLLLNFAALTNPEIKWRVDNKKDTTIDKPSAVEFFSPRRPGCRQGPTTPC